MKEEIHKNNNSKVVSKIDNKKLSKTDILKTYIGVNRGNYNTRAKTFTQEDYEYLKFKYYPDTISYTSNKELIVLERAKKQGKVYDIQKYEKLKKQSLKDIKFWSDKEVKGFGFENLQIDVENKAAYLYSISEPIFTKHNKKALFFVSIFKNNDNSHENFVIIMRKEKNDWIFLEKVESTILH